MRILLTGGSGMVGRNIIDHARASEHTLLAPTSAELDLLDASATRAYIASAAPDVVIHCAGVVGGIQANIAHPVKFFQDNMNMGLNVIGGARDCGVPRLLNMGSSCMYPRAAENPLREESILTGELEPTNEGYALAKISSARFCQYITDEHPELDYKTLIPCNLYGPHDKFGENAHMIPAVIAKIHAAVESRESTVTIWGTGEARREFMFAPDLADFVYFALTDFSALPVMLNVGVGHDYTINEYYQEIADVIGYAGSFEHDTNRPVGMLQKLVDTSKSEKLGWRAPTPLRDGIKFTYDYYLRTRG